MPLPKAMRALFEQRAELARRRTAMAEAVFSPELWPLPVELLRERLLDYERLQLELAEALRDECRNN